jgi:recombination protein RecA
MEDKQKALSAALSQIERQFGKGTVMRLGDKPIAGIEDVISTGSLG